MIYVINRQRVANISGIISLFAIYGAIFVFGVILQTVPPKLFCDILAWTAFGTSITSFIVVPKDTKDMGWTALSFLSLAASVVYLLIAF